MILSYQVKNLRAFEDSGEIELKPLTIFVGKNSSGKSTLTRIFPLMRQSVEEDTKGPILWYGKYVDFDSFLTAKNRANQDDYIAFDFKIKMEALKQFYRSQFRPAQFMQNDEGYRQDILVSLNAAEDNGRTITKSVKIKTDDFEFSVYREGDGSNAAKLLLDGQDHLAGMYFLDESIKYGIVPTIYSDPVSDKLPNMILNSNRYYANHELRQKVYSLDIFINFQNHFHGVTSNAKILGPLRGVFFHSKRTLLKYLKRVYSEQSFFIGRLNKNPKQVVDDAFVLSFYLNLNNFIDSINNALYEEFKGCRYLAPMRAAAERFYRFQDLRVDELDHTGSNLVMFLSSLSQRKRNRLSVWLSNNFDFELKIVQNNSHYALEIKPGDSDNYHNMSDMGFGFSQVLPILVSIWVKSWDTRLIDSKVISKSNAIDTFVIEQPELHLHPEMQFMLAKVIAKIAGNSKYNVRFIIETHSKTFIDSIGASLRAQTLKADQVSLNIIEPSPERLGCSAARRAYFNEKGQLTGWPIGFFTPQG